MVGAEAKAMWKRSLADRERIGSHTDNPRLLGHADRTLIIIDKES